MMSMMGLMSFAPFIIYLIIPLFAFAYIFLKWRSYRDGLSQDPDLGKKVILFYFKTIAFHLFLISLTLIISSLMKWKFKNVFLSGTGILLGSSIVFGVHYLVIKKIFTSSQTYYVRRFYDGFNLFIVGLIGLTALIITIISLVKVKTSNIQLPLSAMIIYCTQWIYFSYIFLRKQQD